MKIKLISISLVSVVALTSCQTTNPYTGARQNSRATSGAIIGGLIGAGLGSLTGSDSGERRRRAMVGAGIGALSGGIMGDYMDQQEATLRKQLDGTGVSVTRNGNNLTLNMPGDITFSTDSSSISPGAAKTLDSVGIVLAKYNRTLVDVTGHTDNIGARNYNYRLSERRANSVANYLRERGVVPQRLYVSGRGPDKPIVSNNSASNRQLNRRVTIHLRPLR